MPLNSRTHSAEPWRACYQAHASRLLLYARQWLPCRADAEDAVQAGFVKFWRLKPDACEEDIPLLYVSVRSAALDLAKSRQRRTRREEIAAAEREDLWWDADTFAERERAEAMQEALSGLSPDQREVVVLRVWAEMTFSTIAEALGESINTITARYRYALSNLKKLIPEETHERD